MLSLFLIVFPIIFFLVNLSLSQFDCHLTLLAATFLGQSWFNSHLLLLGIIFLVNLRLILNSWLVFLVLICLS